MATSSDPPSEKESPYILPTTVGIPEEQSLRHIIHTAFPNGMPEDFIAIIMRDILAGLAYLHVSLFIGHNAVNSSNICVDTKKVLSTMKLAFDPVKHFVDPGPAWGEGRYPNDGIRGLGITALEMGFGSLPRNCTGNADLVSLANSMIRILKLKLGYPDEQGEEKAENKGKEKLVIDDDQEVKEKAMQKGEGKLVILDDQEMKEKAMQKEKEKLEFADDQEKAMQKGKEKVELADDQEMKEKAKQKGKEKLEVSDDQELKEKAKEKGKEKLEIADEELKNSTIKLPALEKLLNISSVESPEKKLIKQQEGQQQKKKAMAALARKFKNAMKFFLKNKNKLNNNADEREFSRDFLEVVLMCLEEQKLTTAKQILEHPFFQKPVNLQKFERSMRSRNFH